MITRDSLFQYRKKYWNLYYVEIAGVEFLFRELSRVEYKSVLRSFDMLQDQEDYICKLCVIEPEDFDFENCPAGIPESLAQFILVESGFSTDTGKLSSYLETYRKEMETFDNQMSCIIHEAFPTLTLEEIESWPMEKAIWYLSRSEYILNSLRGVNLQYVSKEDMAKQQDKVKRKQGHKARTVKPVENPEIPEETPNVKSATEVKNEIVSGDMADFPELNEVKAFMDGKLFK